jgi:hypothetical protein
LGSTREIGLNLGETVKKTNFTPPGPIKATPTLIASIQDDVCQASFSDAGDVMVTSPNQSKDVHDSYSTPTTQKPPEDISTAVITVTRGNLRIVTTATTVTSTISKN